MQNSYSIHAYQNAFLVFDNAETWLAASKSRSTQVINEIITSYTTSIEEAPILFRDSLCNWTGLLVSKEGNFYGFLPLKDQPPISLSGKRLASFLNDQFAISLNEEIGFKRHG